MNRKIGMFLLENPKFAKVLILGIGTLTLGLSMDISEILGRYEQLKNDREFLAKEEES